MNRRTRRIPRRRGQRDLGSTDPEAGDVERDRRRAPASGRPWRQGTWRGGALGRAGHGDGRGRTDPSVSRLGLVQTAARELRPTMDVPGTERERHERRGREPEGGGTEEKKRGRGDGVLVVLLLAAGGELLVIPSGSSRGGASGWRGLLIGGFGIGRDPEVDGELVAAEEWEDGTFC